MNPTKTNAGTRKLPITDDVAEMFQAIIEDRIKPKPPYLLYEHGEVGDEPEDPAVPDGAF